VTVGEAMPMPMLRPMRWWDLEALAAVEPELFGAGAWTAETFWSELAEPSRWYVVADGPDGLLGYAGLRHAGAEADVQTLAVLPVARRTGVGGLLLRALLAEASRRGATGVLLEVRADNEAAIALYTRHGFERISVRRGYYQPEDVDAVVMRLRPIGVAGDAGPVRSVR